MKSLLKKAKVCILFFSLISFSYAAKSIAIDPNEGKTYFIDENASYFVNENTWQTMPQGGDTIFISSSRTKALTFQNIIGSLNQPIVVINSGGQVQIDAPTAWGAITFENCKYIKISGTGHPGFKYGITLSATTCGLAFTELSSDCEAEYIKINHEGFFGIMAKKDYSGNPPSPVPVFSNLIIHDCFIENVTEGMYLGETKSPGMEFKHVKIYNNIVRNTGREAIQIANMTEDVAIHNNTLLNSGQDSTLYQTNILQIGDNSAAFVYNNILIGAPSYGIISMGNGNNIFENNYIANCNGMFIDNRIYSDSTAIIKITNNYFRNISDDEIVDNMNQINFLNITDNEYNRDILFYNNRSGNDFNFYLQNNNLSQIEAISFNDPQNNDYSLKNDNPIEYSAMGAPGGPEYFDYVEPETAPISKQIVLTPEMITDSVEGGSYYSPNHLVDEQFVSVENNDHPVSQSWKPHWNLDFAPYHVIIDLKGTFHLTSISLHDMHNVANLEVSYGEPNNWEELFTELCNNYKTWKIHEIDITTRYIRLTMSESVYAAVNEIILFGYPVENKEDNNNNLLVEKSVKNTPNSVITSSSTIEEKNSDKNLLIYPNPVQNKLNIDIPHDWASNYRIEIFNIQGVICYTRDYNKLYINTPTINLEESNIDAGIYFMRFTNDQGFAKTVKFVKNT